MRKPFRVIGGRLTAVALASGLLCAGARAQTSTQDHTVHHPGQNTNAPTAEPMPQPSAAPTQGGQMGGMMEGGMERHGAAQTPKELYPSLMELPELSSEKRTEVERAARERMEAGRERLAAASERLAAAAARGDYGAMEEEAAQAREAVALFESGLAARRALAEGKPPRGVALEWFRREMNLLPPVAGAE
ncbi:MAG TPA: oxidoreductase, partial [Blastocatellia bacterium]|nr:oxidoreductase [Blastocatellia bacterium]